ncbi:MAG: hypothetical protein K2H58_08920 [Paramuribaculum sp.]|nr:hypothetical protein [Paramuribaculum sp.]
MTHANNPQHETHPHSILPYLIERVEAVEVLSSPAEDEPRIYDNKVLKALHGVKNRYL